MDVSCGFRSSDRTARLPRAAVSLAARPNRSSSLSGRPTGCCISWRRAAAGGISYRWNNGGAEALWPMEAEFGRPQWQFAMSTYAFASASKILCCYAQGGLDHLAWLDTARRKLTTGCLVLYGCILRQMRQWSRLLHRRLTYGSACRRAAGPWKATRWRSVRQARIRARH